MMVGDRVTWESKGRLKAGERTTKVGIILGCVPAGFDPHDIGVLPKPYKYMFRGGPRSSESWLVGVPMRLGEYLYWPRTKNLRILPERPECFLSEGPTVDREDSTPGEQANALRHPLFPRLHP